MKNLKWVFLDKYRTMRDNFFLMAIQSMIELNQGYDGLNDLLKNIKDKSIVKTIIRELKMRNFGNIGSIIDQYLFDSLTGSLLFDPEDIKQFNFDVLENKKLDDIKCSLDLSQLNLNKIIYSNGKVSNIYRHWDNINRFAVIIHKSLVDELKSNTDTSLSLSKELIISKLGYYTKFTIYKFEPTPPDQSSGIVDERPTFGDYNGSYAQDYAGYSDQLINDALDGDPDFIWNYD